MRYLTRPRPPGVLVITWALALAAGGCGDSTGPFDTAGQPTTVGQESTTSSPGETTTGADTTTALNPSEQYLPIGSTPIEQLTPEQGAGAYPFFEWAAVPDAALYLLFVLDANGVAYWAWQGTATSVYLGGLDQPPTPGSMGPVLDAPMSWAVVAFDSAGEPIASSAERPISP